MLFVALRGLRDPFVSIKYGHKAHKEVTKNTKVAQTDGQSINNSEQIKLIIVVHLVFNFYLFTYLTLLHAIIRTAIAEICPTL